MSFLELDDKEGLGMYIKHDFRLGKFVINNAEGVMKKNTRAAMMKNGCGPCKSPADIATMLPEQTKVRCDKRRCYTTVTDVSGLGQGRMFSEEPLAGIDAYGEVVIRDADDVNCCGKPQEVFNYYGDAVLPEKYLDGLNCPPCESKLGGLFLKLLSIYPNGLLKLFFEPFRAPHPIPRCRSIFPIP